MMMYPSSASSSSAHSASVRVEKATSEFLNGPDWTINIDICDAINLNNWLAKDIVKALKKRLQHKNSHVHLLALTLLETMVKNCGEPVHSQIVERNILQDMTKIVKKKTNMTVREKILVLLDSWQQAFGGAGGRYPQYYWAYEELRRAGVEFPQRASDSALIFTPPVTHSTAGRAHAGYGMPSNSSTRLDEAMASEIETLSLSSISSMQEVLDLLSAMLQAVDPNDRMATQDEVIVDLVDRCRSNHKKLMQMLTTTGDEELLARGLELNDGIQNELAKHDAIAAGHPLPTQVMSSKPQLTEVPSSSQKGDGGSKYSSSPPAVPSAPSNAVPSAPSNTVLAGPSNAVPAAPSHVVINAAAEEEEEEDEFAQLARRHSKMHSATSQNTFVGASEAEPSMSNALVISDPPVPVKITKEQDMIDFLSLALSTTGTSPKAPESSTQNMQQAPVSPSGQGSSYAPQTYTGNQGQVSFSSYVAPWAQPQHQIQQAQLHQQAPPQQQQQLQTQGQPQQAQYQAQAQSPQFSSGYPPGQPQPPQYLAQAQSAQFSSGYPHGQPQQPQYQIHGQRQQPQYQTQGQPQQPQFQTQAQTTQYSSAYPPPPWAATPGYYTNPRQQVNTPAYRPQGAGSLQQVNSAHGTYVAGDGQFSSRPTGNAPAAGQKTFVPSYRLFEDLNVLGNGDGRSKTNNTSPSLSGTTQSMGGGWNIGLQYLVDKSG
ncbi:vacuolar protein sorting-associated protein 27 [Heracleum sosnowskyi]|uniref:Vacuolar protein sorting-associated protein 27 n=1 Tax=Heracleum sosnowskyi TaxID=360622 RepID=A0AAD8J5U1_9APIA|nr:vacuolar protein sorting-associated protein 27 [Heracleum sosnowskyi]